MADDNFNVEGKFDRITEVLNTMRSQSNENTSNINKVISNISSKLETLVGENTSELSKVFLAELKRSLDERYEFVSTKFDEMETRFNELTKKSQDQIKGSEIKDIFEIIENNFNGFTKEFKSQKNNISQITTKINDIQEATQDDIIKNISSMSSEMEKFGNGFESIVINLNENFENLSEVLNKLDSQKSLSSIKKDVENIYLSSNAILSTMQVLDKKNQELENIVNQFITKEDFQLEREQVAKLIAQNLDLTNYINNLATRSDYDDLAEKIDTSIGVINALKNMLNESNKQNQSMLSAQLESLETKILNISSEDEFIGFRKELSNFAKEVMSNTESIRADLADTNSELQNLYKLLNSLGVKEALSEFGEISKEVGAGMQKSVSDATTTIRTEIQNSQSLTKADMDKSFAQANENLDSAKAEIKESSKSNLASIVENVQSVVNSIFSARDDIKTDNADNLASIDDKFQELKDEVVNTSNYVTKSSHENVAEVISGMEELLKELEAIKDGVTKKSDKKFIEFNQNLKEVETKLNDVKTEITAGSLKGVEDLTN